MTKSERIEKWASELSAEEMRPALITLVEFAIDAEQVALGEAPYWTGSGDALVECQKPFEFEDDEDEL
jgi:hypothetical protein